MPISLPAGLSKPLVDFAAQEADMGETCEFEAGEDRRSPISTTVPSSVEVRWHMTQAQFDLFDAWFEDDLFAGSLTFDLPVPIQGGTLTELQEAMFLEPSECTYVHKDNWEVSAKCVVGLQPTEFVFLETFSGTPATALTAHTPDIAPTGFGWADSTSSSLVLAGDAAVSDDGADAAADSTGSSPPVSITLPTSYWMELTGNPAGSPVGPEETRFIIGTGIDDGINERFRIRIRNADAVNYSVFVDWIRTGYGPTGNREYIIAGPLDTAVVVRFSPTEFEVWIDGALATPTSGPAQISFAPITALTHIGVAADAQTEDFKAAIKRAAIRLVD